MGSLTDVFQLVACLPNLPEKEFKTGMSDRVSDSLAILDKIQPNARKEYIGRLARRARHHKSVVDKVAKKFGNTMGIVVTSNRNEQLVRDFYHNAYYAAFFVARFALVSSGAYDCTSHSAVDGLVRVEIPKRDPLRGSDASALAQKLADWRDYRNVADYIMSENKISALANPQPISLIASGVQSLFVIWNVP